MRFSFNFTVETKHLQSIAKTDAEADALAEAPGDAGGDALAEARRLQLYTTTVTSTRTGSYGPVLPVDPLLRLEFSGTAWFPVSCGTPVSCDTVQLSAGYGATLLELEDPTYVSGYGSNWTEGARLRLARVWPDALGFTDARFGGCGWDEHEVPKTHNHTIKTIQHT